VSNNLASPQRQQGRFLPLLALRAGYPVYPAISSPSIFPFRKKCAKIV
jgi:hypothetical protein